MQSFLFSREPTDQIYHELVRLVSAACGLLCGSLSAPPKLPSAPGYAHHRHLRPNVMYHPELSNHAHRDHLLPLPATLRPRPPPPSSPRRCAGMQAPQPLPPKRLRARRPRRRSTGTRFSNCGPRAGATRSSPRSSAPSPPRDPQSPL